MIDLKNKKVAFLGAVGYLATPIVRRMAEQGAHVAIADADEQKAEEMACSLREHYPDQQFEPIGFHSGDYESIQACFAQIQSAFGGLDAAVSGIAGSTPATVDEMKPEELNTTFATHVTGSFLIARHAARLMEQGGSIVLFSSMYGQVAPDPAVYHAPMKPNPLDYGLAKAALNQMIRYLAVAWGPKNIRVNGVAPGPFPNAAKYEGREDFIERLAQKVPMGRVGRQDEMCGAVLYLASDASRFTNGHILVVDGGWTAW